MASLLQLGSPNEEPECVFAVFKAQTVLSKHLRDNQNLLA